jgi:murein DD-endopeptidase MepM/ murein hydrolase activator NlpD
MKIKFTNIFNKKKSGNDVISKKSKIIKVNQNITDNEIEKLKIENKEISEINETNKIKFMENIQKGKEPTKRKRNGASIELKNERNKEREDVEENEKIEEVEEYKYDEEKEEKIKKEIKQKKQKKKAININFKKSFDNFFKNKNKLSKGYYFLMFAMLFLSIASVGLTLGAYNLFNKEDYQVYSNLDNGTEEPVASSISQNEEIKEENNTNVNDLANNKDTVEAEAKKTTNTSTQNKKVVATKKKEVVKVIPLEFVKPVQGEILKGFSIDKVIYSKTLELWKTHDGIDIKASIGTDIKSIEKGTVEKIYDDSFYGVTVVIDHGQGYKSSYSNLDKNTVVKEKQSVKKSQVIGRVSNTAIGEIKDEPHLHFMLFKNNEIIDPTYIFKN